MATDKPFLGKGLAYPLQLNASGDFKVDINNLDTVKSSLIFLLHTRLGERPHRPETGSRLPDFKHEPNSKRIRDDLALEIKGSISDSEPRISDLEVFVEASNDERQIIISISYIIIAENVRENLVFPFFLGE